jgi:ABC-type multidrug transport system ATPase subunit
VVASVHRMSALAHFDRIVLMAEGRIVDSGSVHELLQRQALFRDMFHGAGAPTKPGWRAAGGRVRSRRQKAAAAAAAA